MADSPSSDSPPPSWYPDPKRESELRWWNGRRWTIHTATRAAIDAGEVERPPAVTPPPTPAPSRASQQAAPTPAPTPAAADPAKPKRPSRSRRPKRAPSAEPTRPAAAEPAPAASAAAADTPPARPKRERAPRAKPAMPKPSLPRPSLPKASRLWSRPDAQPDERAAAADTPTDAPAARTPAPPPEPLLPLIDRSRANEATWIAVVGAVALIISLFFHWFSLTVNEQGAVQSIPLASSADQWMPGLTWVILAMALATLVLVLCSGRADVLAGHRRAAEFSRAIDLLVHPAATIAPLAAVAVIAYRVASPPSLPNAQAGLPLHGQVAYGSIVGLICAVAMSLGVAWFAMVTRYRPERPARRRPAATHA